MGDGGGVDLWTDEVRWEEGYGEVGRVGMRRDGRGEQEDRIDVRRVGVMMVLAISEEGN